MHTWLEEMDVAAATRKQAMSHLLKHQAEAYQEYSTGNFLAVPPVLEELLAQAVRAVTGDQSFLSGMDFADVSATVAVQPARTNVGAGAEQQDQHEQPAQSSASAPALDPSGSMPQVITTAAVPSPASLSPHSNASPQHTAAAAADASASMQGITTVATVQSPVGQPAGHAAEAMQKDAAPLHVACSAAAPDEMDESVPVTTIAGTLASPAGLDGMDESKPDETKVSIAGADAPPAPWYAPFVTPAYISIGGTPLTPQPGASMGTLNPPAPWYAPFVKPVQNSLGGIPHTSQTGNSMGTTLGMPQMGVSMAAGPGPPTQALPAAAVKLMLTWWLTPQALPAAAVTLILTCWLTNLNQQHCLVLAQARQQGWQDRPPTAKGLSATTLTPTGLSVPPSTLTLSQKRRLVQLTLGQVLLTTRGQHRLLLLQVLLAWPLLLEQPLSAQPLLLDLAQPLLLEQPHLAQLLLLEQPYLAQPLLLQQPLALLLKQSLLAQALLEQTLQLQLLLEVQSLQQMRLTQQHQLQLALAHQFLRQQPRTNHLLLLLLELLPMPLSHLCLLLFHLSPGLLHTRPVLGPLPYPVMLLQRHPLLVLLLHPSPPHIPLLLPLLLPVRLQLTLFLRHQLELPLQVLLHVTQQCHLCHAPRPASKGLLSKGAQLHLLLLLLLVGLTHRQVMTKQIATQHQHQLLLAGS